MQKASAFTGSYDELSSVLGSQAKVLIATSVDLRPDKPRLSVNVIWDTGATNSVISPRVIESLGLAPIGMTNVHTAGSTERCYVYKVDILLPNQVLVRDVKVTGMSIHFADALIGMDIINLGDFAVTNFKGKTRFTFRIPSMRIMDFVKEAKRANQCGDTKDK